jgi:AcrR family transcriptional regulator
MSGFTDEERRQIREDLIDAGRELFSKYGLQKTTVRELTEAVGIAKGTFYRFFDSKEDLYVEVLMRDRERIAGPILEDLSAMEDTREAVAHLLDVVVDEMESNPLMRQVFLERELDSFLRGVSDQKFEEAVGQGMGLLTPVLDQWEASGDLRPIDREVLAGVLRAVVLGYVQTEDLDEAHRQEIRDELVDVVATGLTTHRD